MMAKNLNSAQQSPAEVLAAQEKEMIKRAKRNIIIFVAFKLAFAYGMHRWAKKMADAS